MFVECLVYISGQNTAFVGCLVYISGKKTVYWMFGLHIRTENCFLDVLSTYLGKRLFMGHLFYMSWQKNVFMGCLVYIPEPKTVVIGYVTYISG
jgi:hypothetical protein